MSSDFLLRVALSGWQIMKNFSSRQRLHFFVRFEYDWAFPFMEDTRKGPIILASWVGVMAQLAKHWSPLLGD